MEEELAEEVPRAGLANADPRAARGGGGAGAGLGREVAALEREGAGEGSILTLRVAEPLEDRDEPIPPGLPL